MSKASRALMSVLEAIGVGHRFSVHEAVKLERVFGGDDVDLICRKCGDKVLLESRWLTSSGHARMVVAVVDTFLKKHEHPEPRAMTRDEREAARVKALHRRGALRAGYGTGRGSM